MQKKDGEKEVDRNKENLQTPYVRIEGAEPVKFVSDLKARKINFQIKENMQKKEW